ncbi:MAG: MarR family transcriptional regulator [Bacteroidales bacterium]|nr:MarR family transcriptional regulator [Bacteroidales bacterium]
MILDKQIGVFLNLVHNRFKQHLATLFQEKGFNITPEQFLVMDTLWNNCASMSQQQIADTIIKDKNSVVKLINGLEKKKLVKRVANVDDRRQNLIELTPLGKDIEENVKETAINAVGTITEGISTQEIHTFINVLTKMAQNMKENNLMKFINNG